jgi:hypothetical protein
MADDTAKTNPDRVEVYMQRAAARGYVRLGPDGSVSLLKDGQKHLEKRRSSLHPT